MLRFPKRFGFLWVVLFIPWFSSAQPSWLWVDYVNTSTAEFTKAVAADSASGTAVAVGVFNTDISAFYGSDFSGANGGGFVAKYNSSGSVLWAFKIGNNQDDACHDVAIDAAGNIYVAGYVENIADVKGTSGSSTIVTSAGGRDIFLVKYNAAGQLQWVRRGGGTLDDEGLSVCVNDKNVFVSGYYTSVATIAGFLTNAGGSNQNAFVAAYDLNGNPAWMADAGSMSNSVGRAVTSDTLGVFLAGDFTGSTLSIYDSSATVSGTLTNANSSENDGFVIGFTTSGGFKWAGSISSVNKDFARDITNRGNHLYITGGISASCNFSGYCCNPVANGASGLELFVAQIDKANGGTNWVNVEQGASDQEGLAIDVDANGDLVMGGFFSSSLSFTGGPTFTSSGGEDICIASYKTTGSFQWATATGSSGKDGVRGIGANRKTNDLYLGGEYAGSTAFGSFTTPTGGLSNLFVGKMGCVPFSNNSISSAQTICAGQTPSQLSGTLPSGGSQPYTYAWQQSPNNTVWSSASGTSNLINYSPPSLVANTYYRRVVISGPGCVDTSFSASILITVDQPPTLSQAGTDQAICSNSSAFAANTPGTGTGTWTLIAGTGAIGNINSPTSSVTGLSVGNNIFVWTIANGVCPPSRDTVVIKTDAFPTTANAGLDQAICSSNTNFSGNTPSIGTGTWSLVSGSGTITSVNSPTSSVTGLSPGNNMFAWTITNGSCPPSVDTVLFRVDLAPSTSNAGPNQNICTNSSVFAANNPSVGTGTWSLALGSGTISNINSPTSSVTGLSVGINSFVWTIANGSCSPSRDTVVIQVDALPTSAAAGADQVICSGTSAFAGNTPSVGTGTWSLVSGTGTITSVNSPTSAVNGLSTGLNRFVWTISNGSCPPSRDTVNIMVDAQPTVSNAGANQQICSNSSAFAANVPTTGTGTWSLVSGSGTFGNVNSATSSVTGLSIGQNVFVWSIVNGTCPASKDTVIITVDALPTVANAGIDQTICSTATSFNGNVPIMGSGTWTLASGSGTITSANSPTSSVTGLGNGTNRFVWTITNGSCPPSRDTVQIRIDTMPTTANAGVNQQICSNSSTFAANIPGVGTGTWTRIGGSGTVANVNSATSSVSGLSIGINTFVWSIVNGTCPASRDTMTITVDALPTVSNAGADQTICSSSTNFNGNTPTSGSGTWTLVSGSGFISSVNSPTSSVSGLGIGTNTFVWTIVNGTCPPSRDTMRISVDAPPTQANAGVNKTICTSADSLLGNSPVIGSGLWTLLSGSGTISGATLPKTAVTGLGVGVNRFVWTITNGSCPPSRDTVTITVDAMPTISNAGADKTICASNDTLSGNVPLTGTGVWTLVAGSGSIANALLPKTAVSGLTVGANRFVWTITNGTCPSSRDTMTIYVDALPTTANAGIDQSVCSSSATFSGNIPTIGTGLWSLVSGTGSISNAGSSSSSVNGLSIGPNKFIWTITNGTCPPSVDTVVITVDPQPTQSNAGTNQVICLGSSTTITANVPTVGTGLWTVVSGSGTVNSPTSASSLVTGMSIGNNLFVWTITSGSCPPSRDTVNIRVDDLPTPANAGPDQVVYNTSCVLAANTPLVGSGQWTSISGQVSFVNANDPATQATGLQPGANVLRWTISNGVCADSYDEVTITLNELVVPNGFSPNGDGVNDVFVVPGLNEFTNVKLHVFNRWGNQVYTSSDYKNDWGGRNTSGADLTDDTYYYILRVTEKITFNGFIILKRE